MNILYISKNIPTPKLRGNKIIFTIAQQLSSQVDISFLYPNEYVPWGLHFLPKYAPFYQLKAWQHEQFHVTPYSYIRLPIRQHAFAFFKKLSSTADHFYQKNKPFDLIHAHYVLPDGWLAYLFYKKYKTPYIITVRKSDALYLSRLSPKSGDFQKAKRVLQEAQHILCLNLSQKETIENLFQCSAQIIPHGIEAKAILKNPPTYANEPIKIISVGDAIPLKNISWVIEAVKNYTGTKSIALDIVGNGPLLAEYQALAQANPAIKIHGRIDRSKVLNLMTQSQIFALPSNSESFGLVYLEAAARHNALIGYRKQGVWGVFQEKQTMLFAENYTQFEQHLHQLIDDTRLRQQLAHKAHQRVQELTWKHVVDMYMDVYTKTINTPTA